MTQAETTALLQRLTDDRVLVGGYVGGVYVHLTDSPCSGVDAIEAVNAVAATGLVTDFHVRREDR